MRLSRALLVLVLVTGSSARGAEDPLLRCQQHIVAAAEGFLARREAVLVGCLARAARCPALATAATAADDPCLGAAGARCRAQLGALRGPARRLDATGARCTEARPLGMALSAEDFFDVDDGLAFDDIGSFCPGTPLAPQDAAAASRCQLAALTCSGDHALIASAPDAARLLARLGVPLDDTPCLRAGLCGDGVLDSDEECDDGAGNSDATPDACRSTCVEAFCGDGVVDSNEECDDGNTVDGDGCDNDCTLTASAGVCGDGVLDDGEECDDGALNSDTQPDHCRTDCRLPWCGDGVVDTGSGEECEPPDTLFCQADCTFPQSLRSPPLARLTPAPAPTTTVAPEALARCRNALVSGGRRLFDRSRRRLEGCVVPLTRCLLGSGDDACVARASAACSSLVAGRDAARAAAVAKAASRCAPVPVDALLYHLGYAAVAATCPSATGVGDLVDCALRQIQCDAEGAVSRIVPRAYGLLDQADLNPDDAFPCVTDPEAE